MVVVADTDRRTVVIVAVAIEALLPLAVTPLLVTVTVLPLAAATPLPLVATPFSPLH
jgi:hypothetical protein